MTIGDHTQRERIIVGVAVENVDYYSETGARLSFPHVKLDAAWKMTSSLAGTDEDCECEALFHIEEGQDSD